MASSALFIGEKMRLTGHDLKRELFGEALG